MRLLVDVCIGRAVEAALCERFPHFDVKCVRDIDPHLPDDEIVRIGVSENRLIITADKDFGELAYRSGMSHSGVLLLRFDELNIAERISVIAMVLTEHHGALAGHFCVYQNGLLRIR